MRGVARLVSFPALRFVSFRFASRAARLATGRRVERGETHDEKEADEEEEEEVHGLAVTGTEGTERDDGFGPRR